MPRVFISFASHDRPFVDGTLEPLLRAHGVDTFEMEQIAAGEDFQGRIRAELDRCEWVVVVVSRAAAASLWVKAEVREAISDKPQRVLHVVLDDTDPNELDLRLPSLQGVSWSQDPDRAGRMLLEVLQGQAPPSRIVRAAPARRRRLPLVLVGLALLVALLGAWWLAGRGPHYDGPLDEVAQRMVGFLEEIPFENSRLRFVHPKATEGPPPPGMTPAPRATTGFSVGFSFEPKPFPTEIAERLRRRFGMNSLGAFQMAATDTSLRLTWQAPPDEVAAWLRHAQGD